MSKKRIKVGMGQLLVEGGEPERNLARAVSMIEDGAKQDCDVVLLPECLDLGWTHPTAKTEAQPIPGRYSSMLAEAARRHRVYVCAGLTEKAGERVYNTAILLNDCGELILKYRKINVLTVGQDYYAIGDHLGVVETPLGVIGVNICSDNYADATEIGFTLARMGAQIILSPCAWTVEFAKVETDDPYGEKWLGPYVLLAGLFDLVIVGVTSVGYLVGGPYEGKKMIGYSLAVGKNGVIAHGRYNEFAGEVIPAEIDVPERPVKGTAIGEMLKQKGYYGNHLVAR